MNQKNYGGNSENKNDDILEVVLGMLRKQAKSGNPNVSFANPERIKEMEFVYQSILKSVTGDDTTISYEIANLLCTAGSITIVGKEVLFNDPEALIQATQYADNMEIYARTDGYAVMDFMFHGIATKL